MGRKSVTSNVQHPSEPSQIFGGERTSNGKCRGFLKILFFCFSAIAFFFCVFLSQVRAAEIQWTGADATTSWDDYLNWFPKSVPAVTDDAVIDIAGADVYAPQTFEAKSITIGKHNPSSLTIENFVYGTIDPDNVEESAIYIGQYGTLTLKGAAGVITLKGTLVLGKEAYVEEPSFMLHIK